SGMPSAARSRKPRAAGLPACPCYPSQRVSRPGAGRANQTRLKPTDMPNIGPVELIIILVIALIVIGPGRLPDVGAALGKSIKEFRKPSTAIPDAARVDGSPQAAPAPAAQAAPIAAA